MSDHAAAVMACSLLSRDTHPIPPHNPPPLISPAGGDAGSKAVADAVARAMGKGYAEAKAAAVAIAHAFLQPVCAKKACQKTYVLVGGWRQGEGREAGGREAWGACQARQRAGRVPARLPNTSSPSSRDTPLHHPLSPPPTPPPAAVPVRRHLPLPRELGGRAGRGLHVSEP